MRWGFQRKLNCVAAVAVMLQIAVVTVNPALSYDGLVVKAGVPTLGQFVAPCHRNRYYTSAQPLLGPSKIPGLPGFVLSSAAFRFDLKQNLSTWPVLSNRRERSPPLLLSL